jgi:hypothetical protein
MRTQNPKPVIRDLKKISAGIAKITSKPWSPQK